MSATTESASTDTDVSDDESDEWPLHAQVTQHPHTIIVGEEIVDIKSSARIDSDVENTGHGLGVVYRNPTVAKGTLWRNNNIPEGFNSAAEFNRVLKRALADEDDWVAGVQVEQDEIEAAQERVEAVIDGFDPENDDYSQHSLKVDYKIADPDDRESSVKSVEIQGEEHVTGVSVGAEEFESEQVDAFEEDEVMVWYGGIAAQFISQSLDFCGLPSARYKDSGYLVKGLLQHPLGWFERDFDNYPEATPAELEGLGRSQRRGKLASANDMGRPPRVARTPLLREDIEGEEVFVEIDRYNGGRMLSGSVKFNDFDGDDWEEATPIEPNYQEDAGEVIEERLDVDDATDAYELYHGEGWQPEIQGEESSSSGNEGASFDVGVDADDGGSVEHPTEQERQFAQKIIEGITGTGQSPDEEIFNDGQFDLEGLVGHNADQFEVTPDVSAIREYVYENVSHLDVDALDQ